MTRFAFTRDSRNDCISSGVIFNVISRGQKIGCAGRNSGLSYEGLMINQNLFLAHRHGLNASGAMIYIVAQSCVFLIHFPPESVLYHPERVFLP
jgi:hypothetical protein